MPTDCLAAARNGLDERHEHQSMHATYFGTVAARAAELNSGMLGEIIGLSRRDPSRRVAYINPWLARGELVQVVHRLDRDDRGSATAVVMLTVAVGQSRAEMTFVVDADDLVHLLP
jgi:hypothetical protein